LKVESRKEDEKEGDDDTEGFDGPKLRERGHRNTSNLPGEDSADDGNIHAQTNDGAETGLVPDGKHIERADEEHPGQHDGQPTT